MSLTYAKLQDLRGQGFDTLYKRNKSRWLALAKAAYESYAALLPESEQPRIDDAAKFLYVSLEIDDVLRKMMQENSISAVTRRAHAGGQYQTGPGFEPQHGRTSETSSEAYQETITGLSLPFPFFSKRAGTEGSWSGQGNQ